MVERSIWGTALIAFASSLSIATSAYAQPAAVERVWPEPGNGEARHVIPLRSGGFALAGHRAEADETSSTFITSVGRDGQVRWERRIKGNGGDIAFVIRQLADGGFIIGGWTSDPGHGTDVLLIRTDSSGNLQWRRTIASAGSERITDLTLMPDGGFAMAGQTSTERDSLDAVVIHTDTAGTLKWRTIIGGAGNDRGFYISALDDGGVLMSGLTTTAPAQDADMLVTRLDKDGTLIWRKAVGGPGYQTAHGMLREADGGQLLIGYGVTDTLTGNNGIAYRVNSNGDIGPPMRWGGNGDDRVLTGQIAHGDLFVTGYTRSFGAIDWALYVARIAGDGKTKWMSLFDRAGAQAGNAIAVDNDKVLVVGYEDVGDTLRTRDVLTLLTDIDGLGLRPVLRNSMIAGDK